MEDAAVEPVAGAASEMVRPLEQLFIADGEEWTAQRRKDRQLVVRPLDGGQRGANRLDFLALVERSPADEHVRDPARLERLDVGTRDVGLPAHEAAKQQADVLGRDLDRRAAAAFGDLPLAVLDDPVDERADRARQRLFDGSAGDVAPRVRLGHRQRHDRRLSVDRGTIAGERDIAGLQREIVAGHDGCKRGVHERLNLRHAAKARRQVDERGAPVLDALAHFAIDGDVGAAEPVDRLLRIADQEEASR